MIYSVSVTFFDVKDFRSRKSEISELLDEMGFGKSITTDDGRDIKIPFNMYYGRFEGEGQTKIRNDLTDELKSGLKRLGISARFMISVFRPESWAIQSVLA
ncbi:hypothetical protein [Pseudomonas putida]|uniref:hypothetical protein n=1 Tax=Pseudomonas putida TaxID=303 RepID=UPI0015FB6D89|nr:hypothetical protein [Pseudomonas putida]